MEKHNWVRHTVQPVVVSRAVAQTSIRFNGVILPESQSMFDVVAVIGGEAVSVVGCDSCGLPLSPELYDEPCLSMLEDQLEEGD
jgi:hypothetical protein